MQALLHSVPPILQQATANNPHSARDSWTLLGKSGSVSCGVTAPFSWSWRTQCFVYNHQESVSPVLGTFWQHYGGINGNGLQEGLCDTPVYSTQSPCPCSRLPLTHISTGDTQTQLCHSLWWISGSWAKLSSVQLLIHVQLFETPWTAARQASLSITNSWSLLKLMSIELVMPSNHLILCRSILLLPSIFPSIRVFSNESVLHIKWAKYWSFSFNISPSMNIQDWFPLGQTGWMFLQSKGLSRVFSNTTVQKHQFFNAQLSL